MQTCHRRSVPEGQPHPWFNIKEEDGTEGTGNFPLFIGQRETGPGPRDPDQAQDPGTRTKGPPKGCCCCANSGVSTRAGAPYPVAYLSIHITGHGAADRDGAALCTPGLDSCRGLTQQRGGDHSGHATGHAARTRYSSSNRVAVRD